MIETNNEGIVVKRECVLCLNEWNELGEVRRVAKISVLSFEGRSNAGPDTAVLACVALNAPNGG